MSDLIIITRLARIEPNIELQKAKIALGNAAAMRHLRRHDGPSQAEYKRAAAAYNDAALRLIMAVR